MRSAAVLARNWTTFKGILCRLAISLHRYSCQFFSFYSTIHCGCADLFRMFEMLHFPNVRLIYIELHRRFFFAGKRTNLLPLLKTWIAEEITCIISQQFNYLWMHRILMVWVKMLEWLYWYRLLGNQLNRETQKKKMIEVASQACVSVWCRKRCSYRYISNYECALCICSAFCYLGNQLYNLKCCIVWFRISNGSGFPVLRIFRTNISFFCNRSSHSPRYGSNECHKHYL